MISLETAAGTLAAGVIRLAGGLVMAYSLWRFWASRSGRSPLETARLAAGVTLGLVLAWLGGTLGQALTVALAGGLQ